VEADRAIYIPQVMCRWWGAALVLFLYCGDDQFADCMVVVSSLNDSVVQFADGKFAVGSFGGKFADAVDFSEYKAFDHSGWVT
jgi:predicted alpha/beta hydrolase family esterase